VRWVEDVAERTKDADDLLTAPLAAVSLPPNGSSQFAAVPS
jgi:hypothetical protein